MLTIGILALQGDFAEHKQMLEWCGANTVLIKHAHQLDHIDGLVIPGGESTTIAKLTAGAGEDLFNRVIERGRTGMPIYGTCMGSIFLAREIEGSSQGRLALMDITIRRNAFGPQKFSREQYLKIPQLGEQPFPAVFIRGPIVIACGPQAKILATVDEGIVMARQDNLLVTAFHPELTDDDRVHRYFLRMVEDAVAGHSAAKPERAGLNPAAAVAVSR